MEGGYPGQRHGSANACYFSSHRVVEGRCSAAERAINQDGAFYALRTVLLALSLASIASYDAGEMT
jgi:hypothetical protein